MTTAAKSIKEICRKPPSHWVGDGFHVFPVFANKAFSSELSPFLMFDYAAPKNFPPTTKKLGVGQHPHRGFETVTIAFQGEVEHGDSLGNKGVIGTGDVQWMTAAQGIVHEEFHSRKFAKEGGLFEMVQLWVNLPASKKMTPPSYQEITSATIPQEKLIPQHANSQTCDTNESNDLINGHCRVISGVYNGKKGPAKTHTPVNLWDVLIRQTDRVYDFEIEEGHTTLIFVRRGSVSILSKELDLADVAIMSLNGTKVSIQATAKDTQVLILSGEPINESIAARGPFVMNTQTELMQAMSDFQNGRGGFTHF